LTAAATCSVLRPARVALALGDQLSTGLALRLDRVKGAVDPAALRPVPSHPPFVNALPVNRDRSRGLLARAGRPRRIPANGHPIER
jgi:hypothetical protein